MAFKKTLAERLFNISKISTQTLRNCRISSSAVHLRPATKPRESSISPEPGDNNAVFRRGIHKSAAATDVWSVPIRDHLKEMLWSGGICGSRIRLDGLGPPATVEAERERMSAPAVTVELTADETRKLLRAAQMEAVKARLREVEKTWVTYAEFGRICSEACSDPDQGLGFAKSLDECGAVIVLGKAVCLKPEQVAKAIQGLIPIPGATPNDAKMRELEGMEKQKALIDQKADALVRRELWLGLGYLVVQTAGFLRLTFWELSWDVMEPICFYVTSMYFMAGYAFFLRTSKEPSFEGFFQSRFDAKQKKLMKDHNFDLGRYEELRKACYPLSSFSSDLGYGSTTFDGTKKMPMQFGSNVL
ncbi:calcium uniporter protein 2, mitochondrial [Argentina anserina]|uniref:calcium uniporter protein 2, mitochondrial n=1 Tax=Argentina anserina TaxID=57926 RepID=UPI0021762687|nr:calcium uniporter protein 2, mitochondrial [Potentilla anserina]